jgi:hypothetical protein
MYKRVFKDIRLHNVDMIHQAESIGRHHLSGIRPRRFARPPHSPVIERHHAIMFFESANLKEPDHRWSCEWRNKNKRLTLAIYLIVQMNFICLDEGHTTLPTISLTPCFHASFTRHLISSTTISALLAHAGSPIHPVGFTPSPTLYRFKIGVFCGISRPGQLW